eukprot:10266680-Heterocapsa_arctica.AAC.1
MELDAVAAVARPTKAGKGKGGGPTTTPTGRREVEGRWMRPCRHCNGRHMDKDCPKAPPAGVGAGRGQAAKQPTPAAGGGKSKGKGKNKIGGKKES